MLKVVYGIWERQHAAFEMYCTSDILSGASTQDNVQQPRSTTLHPVLQSHLHLLSLEGQKIPTHDVHAY